MEQSPHPSTLYRKGGGKMAEMDNAAKNQLATILRKSRDSGDENYRFK